MHPRVPSDDSVWFEFCSTKRWYLEASRRADELQQMDLLGTEAKGKERRELSWKSYILKTLFPYSVELFKEESQKISNDTPNTYSVFSCTAVAIRYENQVQTLFWWPETPYLGQLFPCHCTRPVLWTGHFGSNTPIIAGSDVGSHSHAEDTLKTESSQFWAGAWFCSKNHVDNVLKKSWQASLLSILSILFLWIAK